MNSEFTNDDIIAFYQFTNIAEDQEQWDLENLNKDEIKERLTEEIVRRYYYREGEYQQKMAFDPVIVQATQLLHDSKKYEIILK